MGNTEGVHFVQGDIGDYETVARTNEDHRIDAVIHLAARLIARQFEDDPLEYYHANAVKSRALLSAVRNLGIRHFISRP
jgi:UDP-glucose 4-epimerase